MSQYFLGRFPASRMRRNRSVQAIRSLVAENHISVEDFIWPVFIVEGYNKKIPIKSMPGVYCYSIDELKKKLETVINNCGLLSILLFASIDYELKDKDGSEAFNSNNLICRCLHILKKSFPSLFIICDVALDPYTSHGHDGIIKNGKVDNDETIKALCKQALVLAENKCDSVAPSDMMDGRIGAIRDYLDSHKFYDVSVISYAVKYASSFFSPFRDAIKSKGLLKGDKKTYQMDFANSDEAVREVGKDIDEGADIIIIKPALTSLDIIYRCKVTYGVPIFAYQVSGEYSMICHMYENGSKERKHAIIESLTVMKRAGSSAILTYFAPEIALFFKSEL